MAPAECDWTEDISYGSYESLAWVLTNDRHLAEGLLAHNEKRLKFCER